MAIVPYRETDILRRNDRNYELRPDEISDGQRALIVLDSLVRLTGGQGYTLFLNGPDNYVALAEIQPWLIELADARGDRVPQGVLCSHHPELSDYLGPNHGILLEAERCGATRVKALAETTTTDGLRLSEFIARQWQQCAALIIRSWLALGTADGTLSNFARCANRTHFGSRPQLRSTPHAMSIVRECPRNGTEEATRQDETAQLMEPQRCSKT